MTHIPDDERAVIEDQVKRALDHIQRAQNELALAGQQLSSIIGANASWDRVSKLHNQVKAGWYKLDGTRRSTWKLDAMNRPAREREGLIKPKERAQ